MTDMFLFVSHAVPQFGTLQQSLDQHSSGVAYIYILYTHIYIYTYIYIFIYIDTYIHIHTCVHLAVWSKCRDLLFQVEPRGELEVQRLGHHISGGPS